MPRYHFDLVDSQIVADEGGAEMPDEAAATVAADLLAKRLIQERPELRNRGFAILVTDEDGEQVGRFPLDVIH
ncbi:DUF6894 family protein [uncultured Bradyrhizobium sp.]|uniref:DUF6894 family protein n=1 Tax=uncultured Bradyrhizobium sp. TaxID=199684 RepID=UPI0035CC67CF